MTGKRHKIPNLHQQKFRRKFETQKRDAAFKRWKLNRLQKQGGRCFYCHDFIQLKGSNVEHLIPLWRGGTNKRENLVVSCGPCNRTKGISIISAENILKLRQELNKLVKEDLRAIEEEDERFDDFLRSI